MNTRIAVFVSGEGTNFTYIHRACQSGDIAGQVVLVVSDRVCPGISKAVQENVPVAILPKKGWEGVWDILITNTLHQFRIDLVCLAGFMKLIPATVCARYPDRILNIHPGLLPLLAGKDPQKRALELGLDGTGNVVHIVTEKVDSGYVLAEDTVPIFTGDTEETLSTRLKEKGWDTYVYAILKWKQLFEPTLQDLRVSR